MKDWILLSTWLTAAVLVMPQLAEAQTIKLHKKTTSQGETVQTPYISYDEFQSVSLGRAVSGKTTSDKSSGEKVTFGDLAFVSSIEEVKRVFGEPKKLTHDSPYEDGKVVYAFLTYDGLRFEYVKYNKKYKLRELELTSSDWSFTVNGTQLRPGMSVDQLSPAVRQTLNRDFGKSVDAVGAIVVAKPGTAKQAKRGGGLEQMGGDTEIRIEVNGGTVDRVSFGRMLL